MEHPWDLIIVRAKIHLRATAEGGRKTGFKSGYRPNHVFERKNDGQILQTYVGDILFDHSDLVEPGTIEIVTVRFLKIPEIEKYIRVGQKWWIYEVPRIVAEGEILEVIN